MAKYLDYEGLEYYTEYIKDELGGKAAASHDHSAASITSGTLAVARGGTGMTSSPSMLTNLGTTSAASVFAASPRPGVTGTLPVANGGTGATTAAAARTALGITPANIGAAASDHTHSAATASAAGLMSASDKSKLDGIAAGANNYTYSLPTASASTLGGVKTGSNITNSSGTISLTKANVTAALGYTPPTTNSTYTLGSFGVTATAAELNALDGITATVTELNYMDGVTSNVQTQLNAKAASSHSHAASAITSGTFPTARIADGAVTTAKLAADSITLAKLGSDVGTVAVSSTEPTDPNVLFWVEIQS